MALADDPRPKTGSYIMDRLGSEGDGELCIKNDCNLDAVAVLADQMHRPVLAAYVRASDTFVMTGIDDDIYNFYYYMGQGWNGRTVRFSTDQKLYRLGYPLRFNTIPADSGIEYTSIDLQFAGNPWFDELPSGQFPFPES